MLAEQPITRKITVEEYLKQEEKSEVRHEFFDGETYAMAGGTINHNRLTRRVSNMLESHPSLKKCGIFSENMKVDVQSGLYMPYPDVVLTCHPFDLRGSNLVIRQPRLLVEVLSKSTAHTDRGFKWLHYRKMPSLWYYMLVDQYSMMVELFSRIDDTNEWINTLYEAADDQITLTRIDCTMRVSDIYTDVDLTPPNDDDPFSEGGEIG